LHRQSTSISFSEEYDNVSRAFALKTRRCNMPTGNLES
jgi:hypothetical protein